jgi:TonB family protein
VLGAGLLAGGGCSSPPPPVTGEEAGAPAPEPPATWHEVPNPDMEWRPHLLQRCRDRQEEPSAAALPCLREAWDLFAAREGAAAIEVLEACLRRARHDPLLLLTLGQLYVMAGQGEPGLVPAAGPAADVGDWRRNRRRLLARAEELLQEAWSRRPEDAAVVYLLADVARARLDTATAGRLTAVAGELCSLPESFEILQRHQQLNPYPARILESPPPEYPDAAARDRVSGRVVLDLLISPAGRIVQSVPVSSPDPRLTAAAAAALQRGRAAPARLGKYPVWSWLRIPVDFTLKAGPGS